MGHPTRCLSHAWLCVLVLCAVQCCAQDVFFGGYAMEDATENVSSICDMKGCNCTYDQSDKWIIVNCSFNNQQMVDLRSGFLPSNLMELSVIGGHELRFHAGLFNGSMRNLWRLRVDGTRTLLFKKHAFFNVTVTSTLVEITACNRIVFQSYSFSNEGPVVLNVSHCEDVSVHSKAWSFLQSAEFSDVTRLELLEGAFILRPRINDRHGPVTEIKFRNALIRTLPKDVFKSTLAEVSLTECEVVDVMSDAFSGNTISAVRIVNSTLHHVHPSAFSERTQLYRLEVVNSHLHVVYPGALLSATTNLTISHSKINTIYGGALNATIARTVFTNNEVGKFQSKAFAVHDWSQINIENNNFSHMYADVLDVPFTSEACQEPCEFTFTGNEMTITESGALKFITLMPDSVATHFEDNNFKHTCHCDIDSWLEEILGGTCQDFSRNNYCIVDSLIAGCYDIPEGLSNIRNFTDVMCASGKNVINCKTYSVDANVVNTELQIEEDSSQLLLVIVVSFVVIIAVVATAVILLIQGGIWLKRKGYCVRFSNFSQYRVEDESTEIEEIMVPQATKMPENNIPEELTQDLLQTLRDKLEDPLTYDEAREMIEKLYDHFIIDDSYTNNNRHEEEAHLYEELGNLNHANQQQLELDKTPARPFSFLRLIEERFNLTPSEPTNNKSVLVNEYSEPTDAEVHLYSELPQNKEGKQNEINEGLTQMNKPGTSTQRSNGSARIGIPGTSTQRSNGSERLGNPGTSTLRSNGSAKMAYRPLPDKPKIGLEPLPGPSTKY